MKILALKNKLSSETLRFILVGILNTIVGYGCYFVLLYLQVNYIISLAVSHIVGVTNSFFWNKYWTFRSNGNIKHELVRFILVYVITFFLNLGVLVVFVEALMIDKRIAQVYALFIVTIVSYLGHKLWSFKDR